MSKALVLRGVSFIKVVLNDGKWNSLSDWNIQFKKDVLYYNLRVEMRTDLIQKGRLKLEFGRRFEGSVLKPIRIMIRPAYREEWDDAMVLAWRTFMQFEAKDCTPRGIESFLEFITDEVLHRMFVMGAYQLFCAYDNGKMVGMISLRGETHISLLFVDERYHRMGIGRRLIDYVSNYVLTEEGHHHVTVNAASGATGFYHCVGFVDTDKEQINDGIRFTPMKRKIEKIN